MWAYAHDDPAREKFTWVDDFEYEATYENPEVGFELVLNILRRKPTIEIIEVLAAGPLEQLLSNHGELVIEWVEKEAKSNKEFAGLLGGVWQNAMSEDIWNRVQSLWDRREWAGG